MTALKSFTDTSQSKKLAEILPLESADMYWWSSGKRYYIEAMDDGDFNEGEGHIRAWSLAALLGVLPLVDFATPQLIGTPKTLYRCMYNDDLKSHAYDNPVDACYELIVKLHELKML